MSNKNHICIGNWCWLTQLTLTVLMTSSCGLFSPDPGKVVEKFYRYVEKGELEAAKNLFAKPIQEALGGEIIASLAKETREIKSRGGVKDIEIKNEEITGESAQVSARVIYGDGSNKNQYTNLIKEDGAWKYIEVRVGKLEVKTARAQIDGLEKALNQYRIDTGHYPSNEQGLAALYTKPADEARWDGPYLKKTVPNDPWGNPYHYRMPGEHSVVDIFSFGRDGQSGGSGDDADINNW